MRADVAAEHAGGEIGEAYRASVAARLPALALPLDEGRDSMRVLYLAHPDALGEYPVLFIDHDDSPVLGVAEAGFDVWLPRRPGVAAARAFEPERTQTALRVFGSTDDVSILDVDRVVPAHVAAPLPGSVVRAPTRASGGAAPGRKEKLTDKQLVKALINAASDQDTAALRGAIDEVQARKLGTAPLDDALLAAVNGPDVSIVAALLDAGANVNACRGAGRSTSALALAAMQREGTRWACCCSSVEQTPKARGSSKGRQPSLTPQSTARRASSAR